MGRLEELLSEKEQLNTDWAAVRKQIQQEKQKVKDAA
jgi:hypothetical protein